jgi:peptide/nickel transport system permease protein
MTITELPRRHKPSTTPPQPTLKKRRPLWADYKDSILGMLTFILQRLAFAVLVLLFIIFLSYLGLDMASGTDFTTALLDAVTSTVAYIDRLLQGDLGMTTSGSETLIPRPVSDVLSERLPLSLGLLAISLLFASLVGITFGVLAARSRSQNSMFLLLATLIGISIPSFFAAFLLQWLFTSFTRQTGRALIPVGGFGWDAHLLLPMLVLAARPIAQITRMTFVSIRDVLAKDYVRTAYSKGLHRYQIMTVHVMRNAAIPILTTIGLSLRFSLSSLPVVELYFSWPGAGATMLKSIAQGDQNLTIALALCFGIVIMLVNLFLDLSYRLIDPRLQGKPDHIISERQKPLEGLKNAFDGLYHLITHNRLTDFIKQVRHEPQPETGLKPQAIGLSKLPDSQLDKPLARRRSAWKSIFKNFPFIAGGLMISALMIVVLFGPSLTPNNPFHTQGLVRIDGELVPPPFAPNDTYPWGTDALGRGILSLLLAGAQQTLVLGMLAVAARLVVGVVLGALAGWREGGLLDRTIQGMAEVIAAFPTLIVAMILILAIGIRQGMRPFVIALCFVGWGEIMQFVRSEVIAIRPKLFIESAVAVGARNSRIVGRHILPNLFSALISIAALEMGAVLMLLGELGFISIFIGGGSMMDLPTMKMLYSDVPEWGALLSNVRYLVRSYTWTGFYPMMAFFVAILSFNLFGEGIRRLVEEGNPLINQVINRYTVILTVFAIIGYNWFSANSGAIPYYRQQAEAFDQQSALRYVAIQTHQAMEGRALGSTGVNLAAEYIASEFKTLGVQPAGEARTYFQTRKRAFEQLDSVPLITLNDGGVEPIYGIDYAAYPGGNVTAGMTISPVRVITLGKPAGSAPGYWRFTYPELQRADFTGEIVLTFSDREAQMLANTPKSGMLVVTENPDLLSKRFTLSGHSNMFLNYFTGDSTGVETPSIWISEEMAARLLSDSGYTVTDIKKATDELALEEMFQLPLKREIGMKVDGTLVEGWPIRHVQGYLPGYEGYEGCRDCLGQDMIVVLAQYDRPPIGPEGVYSAANDNASAVAIMLEAIRTMNKTDYQPLRSFAFIAYSGEGLDGGEPVNPSEVRKFLQVMPGFSNFNIEAIVHLRGLGGGSGDGLEISAGGSLRLAELFEQAAKQMGVDVIRADQAIEIGLIYQEVSTANQQGQEAPEVRMSWQGWQEHARLPSDTIENINPQSLDDAGKTLTMALMILGRERQY